jgi:hypothetical protein
MSKKIRKTKEIIYPVFKECSELITDDYWCKLFDDLSRGKCPKGIIIYNGILTSSYKRINLNYNFINLKPEEIIKELPDILKNNAYIYSNTDILKNKELKSAKTEYSSLKKCNDWKKIKNKKMKENLITNYCLLLKKQYKLSSPQTKSLYMTIRDAIFYYKTHKSNDIIMKDGNISLIKDIEINLEYNLFINNRFKNEWNETKTITLGKMEQDFLISKWDNYITFIVKEFSINT